MLTLHCCSYMYMNHSLQMTIVTAPPRPPPSHTPLTQLAPPLLAPPSSSFPQKSSSQFSPTSLPWSFFLSLTFTPSSMLLPLMAPFGSTFTQFAGHRGIRSSTSHWSCGGKRGMEEEEGEGHIKTPFWRMMSSRNCSAWEEKLMLTQLSSGKAIMGKQL